MSSLPTSGTSNPEPLRASGALDNFAYADLTPSIGREFPEVNLLDDIINVPNADQLTRDLGITLAQRGVVFFRAQHNLTDELQKQLIQRLGELTGKPAEASLHIHPILNSTNEFGVADKHISTIDSVHRNKLYQDDREGKKRSQQWHSDLQFETATPDFSSLRLTKLPTNGGDTLWASGYDIYDNLSKPYQKFIEGLTAVYAASGELFKTGDIFEGPRGHPKNVGRSFSAVHPVVRTHPVTGWKSVYAVATFPKYIPELNENESRQVLSLLRETLLENHQLQVRFKWKNENDIAIWDNRCTFHTATHDYDGLGDRTGHRAVGIAEVPYLDPGSSSRYESSLRQ
ncbi:taurine dioxygenase family protein [Xylariaceae sp. FL1272]|nr:taurine dioxygenase family protein [Xylariaceae sp. FL1272]